MPQPWVLRAASPAPPGCSRQGLEVQCALHALQVGTRLAKWNASLARRAFLPPHRGLRLALNVQMANFRYLLGQVCAAPVRLGATLVLA